MSIAENAKQFADMAAKMHRRPVNRASVDAAVAATKVIGEGEVPLSLPGTPTRPWEDDSSPTALGVEGLEAQRVYQAAYGEHNAALAAHKANPSTATEQRLAAAAKAYSEARRAALYSGR